MIIPKSLEQSVIKKDVDHLINVYKLKAALCNSSSSQTLEAHLKEIDLYVKTI